MVHKIEHLTDAAIRVAKSAGVLEMKTSSCYKLAFSLRIKSVALFHFITSSPCHVMPELVSHGYSYGDKPIC